MSEGERRLAAIMFTDMIGYTALGQRSESLSLALVDEQRKLIRPVLTRHNGREVKTMGDGFLVQFPSALDAVRCAYEIQKATRIFNLSASVERRLHLRIGVHLGDIVESQGDISGDAVNVASRIESLAEDGGVCLTRQVYDHVENKFELPMKSLGGKLLKNVTAPIEVYKIQMPWEGAVKEAIPELDKRRVAVLPLQNMSPDPNDEYLSDGMTEELITALSGISELTVIARTSVMQYKNSTKRVADVGRELRTGTIVEGSVRKAANRVRISVQMVDAKSEGHLWGQNYDRQMDDIFGIQSEIAEKVADALKVKLLGSEKQLLERKPTDNTEAYTLYMKGRFYWNERNRLSVEKGIAYLQKAIQADPNLAVAYSDLADAYVVMADYDLMSAADARAKVHEYATKAIEMDSLLSQPHAALATVHERSFHWADANREFNLAIGLNPNNSLARHWYALDLFFRGEKQSAIQEWRRAKELDPLSLIIGSAFGYALVLTGRIEEGLEMQRAVVEMNEAFGVAHRNLAYSYIVAGLKRDAVEEAKKLQAISWEGVNKPTIACVYAMAGLKEEAASLLNKLLEGSSTEYTDPSGIASIYAALEDEANSLQWLEKAVSEKSAGVVYVNALPPFDPLRNNPRFRDLGTQAGMNWSSEN